MNEAIQAKAQAIMVELDRTRFSRDHQPTLFQGIMDLAEVCGTKLEVPKAYGNGEVSIIGAYKTPGDKWSGCTLYGEEFSALLRQIPTRTGAIEYGYKAVQMPYNGWCYTKYWDVELLIGLAAAGKTPAR